MKIRLLNIKLNKKSIPEIVTETIYLLNIFLVPLWFGYFFPSFNMFELSKTIIFRFLLWLFFVSLFVWLIQDGRIMRLFKFFKKENFKSLRQLWWPPLLLIIGLLVVLPLSINVNQSFFGSYTRALGLSSYLSYFFWAALLFLFLISIKILQGKDVFDLKVKRILIVSVLSGFVASIYGILQIMNIDFLTWPEPPFITGRTFSTFGQPNFLASFLLLVIPLSAYLIHQSKSRFFRFFYSLALVAQLACLFFTASRGGLFAFLAVVGILSLGLFFYSKFKKKTKIIIVLSFLFFVIASLATLEFLSPGRIRSSFDTTRGSSASRVLFFQAASNSILDNPIVGYGLENSEEVFIKHYERDWALYGKVSSNADRAHNIVLDILLTTGFFGLILFSLWFYSIFRLGFIESTKGDNRLLSLAITLSIAGYLLSLLFGFQIVVGEIFFWLLFAILAALSYKPISDDSNIDEVAYTNKKHNIILSILGIIVLIISFLGIRSNAKLLLADNYLNAMHVSLAQMKFARAQLIHKQIINIGPNPIQQEKATSYLANNITNYCLYNPWRDLSEKRLIEDRLEELIEMMPDNKYEYLFLKAKIHSCLGNNEEAELYFSKVADISVSWPNNYLEWGRHYVRLGDLKKAEIFFQLVDINLPDVNSELINEEHRRAVRNYKFIMYQSIGEAYQKQGEQNRAILFLEAAYNNKPEDYSMLKKIADSYYLLGDLNSAIKYNLYGVQANPEDHNWHLALAVLYFEINEVDKSIVHLDKAIELAPEERLESLKDLRDDYIINN